MKHYELPLMPGPVSIPEEVLASYSFDYGSPDSEKEFFQLYRECEKGLQKMLKTNNQIAILSGEAMLALWSALKSVITTGDRLLAIGTGVFGYGIGEMAKQIGADVEFADFEYDEVLDPDQVRKAVRRFSPTLVTAVHCETPSGTLNPIAQLGDIAHDADALLYVDFVASAGGAPLDVDKWGIDLGLLGSQKVLSCMSDLAMVSISERAWNRITAVNYTGYDALAPWRTAVDDRYLPYTHNWQAMAGLEVALERINADLDASIQRHQEVAAYCIERLLEMDVELYPKSLDSSAPTVTAAKVPESLTWQELEGRLRKRGMVVGGSYGPLAGKVFRIGHMGSQANKALVSQGLDVLKSVLT